MSKVRFQESCADNGTTKQCKKREVPVAKPKTMSDTLNVIKTSDMKNPIFQVPFEYGWIREFQYRKTVQQAKKFVDVYYRAPDTGKRFRSTRQIKDYLEKTNDDRLTSVNFTFYKALILPDDKSKEIVIGQLCDAIEMPNNKKRKLEKNALESKLTTNNKATKANNDSRIIPPGENRTRKGSKRANEIPTTNNTTNQNAAINGSPMSTTVIASRSSRRHTMKSAMKHKLEVHELLKTPQWLKKSINNILVKDWGKIIHTLVRRNCLILDITRTIIPNDRPERKEYWQKFATAIVKAQQLKVIKLVACPPHVIRMIFRALPQLKIFNATPKRKSQNDRETNDRAHEEFYSIDNILYNNQFEYTQWDLGLLDRMTNLTELRLEGLNSSIVMKCSPSLEHLIHLKTFALTYVKRFCKGICGILITLTTNLQHFEIGDCDALEGDLAEVIRRLVNLRSLRLENLIGNISYSLDVFDAINGLKALNILELVNVEFHEVMGQKLIASKNFKFFLVVPVYQSSARIVNRRILDCLTSLAAGNVVTRVVWALPCSLNSTTDTVVNALYFPHLEEKDIPLYPRYKSGYGKTIDMVSIQYIHLVPSAMFEIGVVLKVNSKLTARVRLEDIFIDI